MGELVFIIIGKQIASSEDVISSEELIRSRSLTFASMFAMRVKCYGSCLFNQLSPFIGLELEFLFYCIEVLKLQHNK